jgi:pimeloyl-ACP methyl ester carboxylesterase
MFFDSGTEKLFGVLTEPTTGVASEIGVLIAKGAGNDNSISRNHVWTEMASRLAQRGFRVLRFHYTGTGESTGSVEGFDMKRLASGQVQAAAEALLNTGCQKVVMFGACYGARVVLAASEQISQTAGLALESPPLRDNVLGERVAHVMAREKSFKHYLQRAFRLAVVRRLFSSEWRRAYWRLARVKLRMSTVGESAPTATVGNYRLSANFIRPLTAALDHGVPVLFIHGLADEHRRGFQEALDNGLQSVLETHGELVEMADYEGRVHAQLVADGNEYLVDEVVDWVVRRFGSE